MKSMKIGLAGGAAACLILSCFDFGYSAPQLTPAEQGGNAQSSTGGGDAGDCTEGEATPSDTGPQLKFITLNVDVKTLKINAGDVVTWTNTDSMGHSVNAGAPGAEVALDKGGFASPDIPPSGKWAFRFCRPRSAFYFCGRHPQQMNGYRIAVQ